MKIVISTLALMAMATPAFAYIGPGMGAGAIAVVFGVIGSVFLAIFAVLYYPIKRMIKNRKKHQTDQADSPGE